MKLKTLITISAVAALTAAILPAASAQIGNPGLERQGAAIDGRYQRFGGEGTHYGRHRPGRPGGNPDRLIDRLDVNEDGVIDEDEFIDSRLSRLDNMFERQDVDGDGLLSREEAERRRHHRPHHPDIDREAVIQCVRETIADYEGPYEIDDRFDAADLDGNGYLDLYEFSTALEQRAYVLFGRIDADNNLVITIDELEAIQDYQINLRRVIRYCIEEVSDPFEATI